MIPDEIKRMKPLSGKERLGANRDSEYLGAEDIDPGTEPILTIKAIYNGMVTLQRGKENKDVIVFAEDTVKGIKNVRPLIVNATNRKTLRKLFKVVTAETLEGKRIQLYIDPNVRDPSTGDKVDGIRIRPRVPSAPSATPLICESCGEPIKPFGKYSADDMAKISRQRFGGHLYCVDCANRIKAEQDAKAAESDSKVSGEQSDTPAEETVQTATDGAVEEVTDNAE